MVWRIGCRRIREAETVFKVDDIKLPTLARLRRKGKKFMKCVARAEPYLLYWYPRASPSPLAGFLIQNCTTSCARHCWSISFASWS